jgi:hypothetical protein
MRERRLPVGGVGLPAYQRTVGSSIRTVVIVPLRRRRVLGCYYRAVGVQLKISPECHTTPSWKQLTRSKFGVCYFAAERTIHVPRMSNGDLNEQRFGEVLEKPCGRCCTSPEAMPAPDLGASGH